MTARKAKNALEIIDNTLVRGDEKLEASLRRIEEHLGTLPASAPNGDESWKLPETPLEETAP